MRFLPQLFVNNRAWAERAVQQDPAFFERLRKTQTPDYLWIGCADARVPANVIVDLLPGELFVHRNVANLVPPHDANVGSVLQYAVGTLRVGHIIVCGHIGCGGVLAALRNADVPAPLADWLGPVRALADMHAAELGALPTEDARWQRLCELNVVAQVGAVCNDPFVRRAWTEGHSLVVHGWIYDLADGLLRDLDTSVAAPPTSDE